MKFKIINILASVGSQPSFNNTGNSYFFALFLIISIVILIRHFVKNRKLNTVKKPYDIVIPLSKHILLLFFTFGVWHLIWIYRLTSILNDYSSDPKRDPTSTLLLCMFVPFYNIFWTYKTSQIISEITEKTLEKSNFSLVCLLLAIFAPVVSPIIVQDKLNNYFC